MNHLGTLHNLICSGELRAYLSWGYKSATDENNIFKCFFEADDEKVPVSILGLLQGTDVSGTFIGDVVGGMIIDNNDFAGECATGDTYGYTDVDPLDSREKIHICQPTWSLPEGFDESTSTCSAIADHPTEMVDTIALVAIHEMTHYSTVGPASAFEALITDQLKFDGQKAYGIERAAGLIGQDHEELRAEGNADNYAYMVSASWAAYRCSREDDANYGNYFHSCPAPC